MMHFETHAMRYLHAVASEPVEARAAALIEQLGEDVFPVPRKIIQVLRDRWLSTDHLTKLQPKMLPEKTAETQAQSLANFLELTRRGTHPWEFKPSLYPPAGLDRDVPREQWVTRHDLPVRVQFPFPSQRPVFERALSLLGTDFVLSADLRPVGKATAEMTMGRSAHPRELFQIGNLPLGSRPVPEKFKFQLE